MNKKWLVGGGLVLGLIAAGGWRHYMREKATAEPDYLDVEKDGEFAVRDYLPVWVAETFAEGTRREAILDMRPRRSSRRSSWSHRI